MTAIGIAIVILYLLLGGGRGGDTIIQQCALPADNDCQAYQQQQQEPDQPH